MLKHVVQLTGLTALAVALSVGSVAQAAPVASVLTGDEMAFAFAAPVAADGVQVLSQGEMQTTEGAFYYHIARGVVYGAIGGVTTYIACRSCSTQDIAISTWSGFVGGVFNNPRVGAIAGGATMGYLTQLKSTRRW